MADSTNVGNLSYSLELDTSKMIDGQRKADAELKKTGKSLDDFTSSLKPIAGAMAAAFATMAITGFLAKIVAVQREFDKLNAMLQTAAGSQEGGAAAFEALQEFAAKTPYDLAQVTKAFTQLVNLGLTPSERALSSYGNTAAAMGKDLGQLVEAVADAVTGEFERLKEFGIKSKSEGDKVSFTFQGVTTTVKNSASEIEGYLMALGENQFGGAMALQAQTLDGAISNLADSWDGLFRTISESGLGDAIEDTVRVAVQVIDVLIGTLQDSAVALDKTDKVAEDIRRADNISEWAKSSTEFMAKMADMADVVWQTLSVLGRNVAFVFNGIGSEIGGIGAQINAVMRGDFAGAKAIGDMMKADAAASRSALD
ncbi:tape measure protein, partial [Plesiomonas sp.]|uniref:tape measure protein n=1 Tax=Plesiomonas sp. TaxID=2486279 RepID=UPI003F2E27FA